MQTDPCPACHGAPFGVSAGRVVRVCATCVGPADVDAALAELPAELLDIARLHPESARSGLVASLAAELIHRRGQVQALEARCRCLEDHSRWLCLRVDIDLLDRQERRRENGRLRSMLDQAEARQGDPRSDPAVRALTAVARETVESGRAKLRELTGGDDMRGGVETCACLLCQLERAVRAVEEPVEGRD